MRSSRRSEVAGEAQIPAQYIGVACPAKKPETDAGIQRKDQGGRPDPSIGQAGRHTRQNRVQSVDQHSGQHTPSRPKGQTDPPLKLKGQVCIVPEPDTSCPLIEQGEKIFRRCGRQGTAGDQ